MRSGGTGSPSAAQRIASHRIPTADSKWKIVRRWIPSLSKIGCHVKNGCWLDCHTALPSSPLPARPHPFTPPSLYLSTLFIHLDYLFKYKQQEEVEAEEEGKKGGKEIRAWMRHGNLVATPAG